jgi:hypothetical protein
LKSLYALDRSQQYLLSFAFDGMGHTLGMVDEQRRHDSEKFREGIDNINAYSYGLAG